MRTSISCGPKASAKPACLAAIAFDHFGDPLASKRSHSRIDGNRAGAPRLFRHKVVRIPLASRRDDVSGGQGHGAAVRGFVGTEDDAAIVGDVEPLVRIGGDRIGMLDAANEMRAFG